MYTSVDKYSTPKTLIEAATNLGAQVPNKKSQQKGGGTLTQGIMEVIGVEGSLKMKVDSVTTVVMFIWAVWKMGNRI